jgi:hypothetical protein
MTAKYTEHDKALMRLRVARGYKESYKRRGLICSDCRKVALVFEKQQQARLCRRCMRKAA